MIAGITRTDVIEVSCRGTVTETESAIRVEQLQGRESFTYRGGVEALVEIPERAVRKFRPLTRCAASARVERALRRTNLSGTLPSSPWCK